MRKQMEAWHRSELTDVTAKVVSYANGFDGAHGSAEDLALKDRPEIKLNQIVAELTGQFSFILLCLYSLQL
jgi:hypothetical protein